MRITFFLIAMFAVLSSCKHQPVSCQKLLSEKFFPESFSEETASSLYTGMQKNLIRCGGFDAADSAVLLSPDMLGILILSEPEHYKNLTYSDVIEKLRTAKNAPQYQHIHDDMLKFLPIAQKQVSTADFQNVPDFFVKYGMGGMNHAQLRKFLERCSLRTITYAEALKEFNEQKTKVIITPIAHHFFDYDSLLAGSKNQNKPALIYFNAAHSANCRLNDELLFSDSSIVSIMNNEYCYYEARCDDKTSLPKSEQYISKNGLSIVTVGDLMQDIQLEKTKSLMQPLYVVIKSDGKTMKMLSGRVSQKPEFTNFLQEGIKK